MEIKTVFILSLGPFAQFLYLEINQIKFKKTKYIHKGINLEFTARFDQA